MITNTIHFSKKLHINTNNNKYKIIGFIFLKIQQNMYDRKMHKIPEILIQTDVK